MTVTPRLLDLFCGGGGAARGYHLAGFHVTGVDHVDQPRYAGDAFVRADALAYLAEHGHRYDAVHASPPCQAYSRATAWTGDRSKHPDLIAVTRAALERVGRPYVIENVQEARGVLRETLMLCGTAFGLRVRSHRYFEAPWLPLALLPPCHHRPSDYSRDHGAKQAESVYRDALGCPWMTVHEARQAIPPAFTEWIGRRLLAAVEAAA